MALKFQCVSWTGAVDEAQSSCFVLLVHESFHSTLMLLDILSSSELNRFLVLIGLASLLIELRRSFPQLSPFWLQVDFNKSRGLPLPPALLLLQLWADFSLHFASLVRNKVSSRWTQTGVQPDNRFDRLMGHIVFWDWANVDCIIHTPT